ncbi:ABC transporter substrate-binding protein [Roseibium aggregatum]|uniref:ABC transporter substrate-binding protein n=1 Tax=Roseibium aggregatum TaxID=187304 RepID=UPI001E52FE5E|nr:ABC transporter substrate-binding protein [Roseibium aggregatum]
MKKLNDLLPILGALSVIAFTPVSASAEDVTLEVFHAYGSHNSRIHQPVADAFMAAHPGIKIKFRAAATGYDEGHLAILRDALTDNLPDVWYSGYHLLGQLVETLGPREQIADLTPLLQAEGQDWVAKNYDPHVLALGQVDGKQWGMPFNASTPIVYYNLDLVSQAGGDADNLPATWDEAIELAGKINALGSDIDGMTYNLQDGDWLFQALVFSNGGRMMEDGKVVFNGEAGQKSVEQLRRMVAETDMPLQNEEQGIQQFVASKMGMFFGSTAEVRTMGDAVAGKFPWKTAKFPLGDTQNAALPTGGNAAVILAKDEEKKVAAWEFIKFATGPEGQKLAVLGSGYMPTNLRATEPVYLGDHYAKNPDWATSMKQWPLAISWFGYPGTKGVKIWREQAALLAAIAQGEIGTDEGSSRSRPPPKTCSTNKPWFGIAERPGGSPGLDRVCWELGTAEPASAFFYSVADL